jgi:hypothetical protein
MVKFGAYVFLSVTNHSHWLKLGEYPSDVRAYESIQAFRKLNAAYNIATYYVGVVNGRKPSSLPQRPVSAGLEPKLASI